MDTKNKIQTWDELGPALANGEWKILAGSFDPVTAETAERIQANVTPGRRLLVVVRPDNDELFDCTSRAILVAALRGVDAVMIETSQEWRARLKGCPALIAEDDEWCAEQKQEFEALVMRKQQRAAS